jgi:hypothetical protein
MYNPRAKVLASASYRFRGLDRSLELVQEPQGDEEIYVVRSRIANHEGPAQVHYAGSSHSVAASTYQLLQEELG